MAEPLPTVVDHLVFVTPDVSRSIDQLASLLGVRAAVGGTHPRWGTRNALLSLGDSVYLEIMGPDGTPADPGGPRPFGIDGLSSPSLTTWVARSDDLSATVEAGRALGVDLGEIHAGSRTRPDGVVLRWSMTDLLKNREDGIIPYFIDWGDTPHPATTSPPGCRLTGLRARHPEPGRVEALLRSLEVELHVEKGVPGLEAAIMTPRGTVLLA